MRRWRSDGHRIPPGDPRPGKLWIADDGIHQLEGIAREAARILRYYLYFQDDERPIAAQLFGANPAIMADAAKVVEELGFDFVNIIWDTRQKKW